MKILRLPLNNDGSVENGIIRIPNPGYTLEVQLPVGTRFHTPHALLVSNLPINENNSEGEVIKPLKPYSILEDLIFHIQITKAGAWSFYVCNVKSEYDKIQSLADLQKASNDFEKANSVRYIVDPTVEINGKPIPTGALCIQTNYGRCIGYVSEWLKNLKPIADLGYNMIHLPPFEEIGAKSHYSLKDQLQVSKYLFPPNFPAKDRWDLLRKEIKKIEKELGIVFMADIVLNHTNPEAEWLKEHPEAGYNLENSPHLRPAYYVDKILNDLSNEIAEGKVPGLPADLQVSHMPALRDYISNGLHHSQLHRYFTIDVDAAIKQLNDAPEQLPKEFEMIRMRAVNYGLPQKLNILRTRGIINDKTYDMGSIHVDINYAAALYKTADKNNKNDYQLIEEFRRAINTINLPFYQHYDAIIKDIVDSVVNTFQYNRYDPNGPKYGPVTKKFPLVWRYFSEIETKNGMMPLANNGWVFSDNPTDDFIAEGKDCYLRRQVVIWGDNVKLRYGNKPEDNPWLWNHMKQYLISVAEVVQGLRLDNAHSTPLQVSEYFIKEARKINPNLYIVAELFTGSEDLDIKYINHIGINAFIREGARHVEPGPMTHLLWSAGGLPVAAVDSLDSETVIRPVRQIPGVIFDLTHDNSAPSFDPLTVSTAYAMSCSPYASNRGYDDMLSFVPSIVEEFRTYPLSADKPAFQPFRQIINELHKDMAKRNMNEIVCNYYGGVVSIFRCNSVSGEGVWTVIRVPGDEKTNRIKFPSPVSELVFEGRILECQRTCDGADINQPITPSKCKIFLNKDQKTLKSVKLHENENELELVDFPVGAAVVFRTKLPNDVCEFIKTLDIESLTEKFKQRVKNIGIIELAVLLFRCSDEEYATLGHGPFDFPNFGRPFYAGTLGVETAINFAEHSPEGMSSPVFTNIREGDWLIDFMCNRLYQNPRLILLEAPFRQTCESLRKLPRFLIPKYLDRVIRALNTAAIDTIIEHSSQFVQNGDELVKSLALSAISFYTPCKNAQLVHPNLQRVFVGLLSRMDTSTAAGFPHFSAGFMRSWGRDTMIALRGLYMCTGRFTEARDQLVGFAACLRHGLIPNLHDGGMNPRYNARDATWWFLQALQDYAYMSGEYGNVFQIQVPRLFPTDDQREFNRKWIKERTRPIVTMGDIVYEILSKHANGIHFVEWNAGQQIDSVMKTDGFSIDIITDWSNGFILGGNTCNCGTWMDKMGSSDKAGNKGVPATSRDGADIEIIGLLESTLRWLDECHKQGSFLHDGVVVEATKQKVTWSSWSNLICSNFESWFYIPTNPSHDERYFVENKHIGLRGIYKDTVGSAVEFPDYQFRPNICVAMTVAPELFDPVHAVRCLNLVEERLMGKIGMRTLDPTDYRYRPYYRNSEDSEDFFTSQGFNYHNGPEWVWPVGYFFRASMRFRRGITPRMKQMLAMIKKAQIGSWACGLPELTNKDGDPCNDGCQNQAWSISAILDILYDYSLYTDKDMVDWNADIANKDEE
ncbi:Amylo-alpha-1,6-glucosidase family protein [Tritrichomonas foetus]|uniref:Glycogen debranching enzyme n=1 Tax=Tritrichomonas foetus TaxID=1144522 RepID=A0A1J4KP74_9EUKA|nr:Amylo-alpha-1,6-glucosidase family protein [Tritrichomonas foetus]|eukprot:OHT13097.1 Amylo-alpha-1,6-glucosidase family protein [Tritrichomonas foetus]